MTDTDNTYQNFFGIDIAKNEFVVAHDVNAKTNAFSNDKKGFKLFLSRYKQTLKSSLIVLENTGGHEYALINFLVEKGLSVHRCDARKVKSFIRSLGTIAKTDSIDAKGLLLFAKERHQSLICRQAEDPSLATLRSLLSRRNDLVQMQTAEKNRLKAPGNKDALVSIKKHLVFLANQLIDLQEEIDKVFLKKPCLQKKVTELKTITGIGDIVAQNLVAYVPELGQISRRQVASLLGVAPIARDSGNFKGYRGTWGGRSNVKNKLFVAAMAAAHSKSDMGEYYQDMVKRGKHKMVAIVALMRKIIVIANARIRDLEAI